MKVESRTIMFVREVPWNSPFPISTRMVAEQFVKNGWNVIWITPPLMPWHRISRGGNRAELVKQYRENGIRYEHGKVFAYTPRTWIPFSKHFPLDRPFLARWIWHACVPSIRSILAQNGFSSPDFLWLSGISTGGLQKLFPLVPVIHHVTDYYRAYPSSPKTCAIIEKENYQHADHVVVTSPSLKKVLIDDLGIEKDKITFISHGIHLEKFSNAEVLNDPVPKAPHPRIIMLGNLSKVDLDIVKNILKHLREGCILALGPTVPALTELAKKHHNLILEGPISSEKVPSYLAHGDIGLVFFATFLSEVAEHVNPMKFYEYAGAGLPVVSTPIPIYQHFDAPVFIVRSPGQAWEAVQTALEQRKEIRAAMLDFARQNTWAMRYRQALTVLEKATIHHDKQIRNRKP